MAIVPCEADVAQANSAPDMLEGVFETWMKRVMPRDIYRHTQCVEKYWAHGSSCDVNLLTDPYVHELMLLLVELAPSMEIKKTALRESILRCHKKKSLLVSPGIRSQRCQHCRRAHPQSSR